MPAPPPKAFVQLPNYTWIDLNQVVMISQDNGNFVFHLVGGHMTEYEITSSPHDDPLRVYIETWIKEHEVA